MKLTYWQRITDNPHIKHYGCEGEKCGCWHICSECETEILNYGCVNYTDAIGDRMIDDEIEYELKEDKENKINE